MLNGISQRSWLGARGQRSTKFGPRLLPAASSATAVQTRHLGACNTPRAPWASAGQNLTTGNPSRRWSDHKVAAQAIADGAGAPTTTLPSELPLFPMQPMGVFTPGMTKTLHLYEEKWILMMNEVLLSKDRLMATAVLEPYMGPNSPQQALDPNTPDGLPLGGYVGGANFMLSNACLVKVIDAKPYLKETYLVRIRGEGRLGISGLTQQEPYMRAQVYTIPDHPLSEHEWVAQGLGQELGQLDDVMRDVQNLAAKFRSDETAAIQQAMRWVYADPLVPTVAQPPTLEGHSASHEPAQRVSDGHEEEEESVSDAIKRAARLSFAALQCTPYSSEVDRAQVVRARLLAMQTQDVGQRLRTTLVAVQPARDSLAAKCAIGSM